jgi:hypothetical protein
VLKKFFGSCQEIDNWSFEPDLENPTNKSGKLSGIEKQWKIEFTLLDPLLFQYFTTNHQKSNSNPKTQKGSLSFNKHLPGQKTPKHNKNRSIEIKIRVIGF